MTAHRPLPAPGRERWQPLRVGLVDLFYYDVEEFWFRDGRLLLRGNNGTGKSKVLALTLPFLLDGDLSAHRVEPDGDPKKRMEWNLLLGGDHPHPERLGYAWIEFGRLGADGTAHFTTLGCGMKAVSGRGIARHWFFVTDQRIGAPAAQGGLDLLDSTRSPIGRERLADAVSGRGMVYDAARAYRRAVDEALFLSSAEADPALDPAFDPLELDVREFSHGSFPWWTGGGSVGFAWRLGAARNAARTMRCAAPTPR